MTRVKSRFRRLAPLLLVVLFAAWIMFVIVLITVHPNPGGGNPMD